MSDIAIQVDGLGKMYRLGASMSASDTLSQRYGSLRDSLAGLARAPLGLAARLARRSSTGAVRRHRPDFWALRGVNFTINDGEVVGIIGRNGAGKSTLLKLISEITEPTEGRITIHGRVASLLEVGTGFHPELTGRENIVLNGSILGMSRAEIMRKFDEIVAFAEVEQFIDTQVKRYSSGMYLRLAFAVAAHLEPEILVVDEVLAVGDAAFQKKCLGKMSEVARGGRTVLFVSHNMAAVESLCNRGIVLQRGQVAFTGSQADAVTHYLALAAEKGDSLRDRTDRQGSGEVRIVGMEVRDTKGNPLDVVASGMDVDFYLHFESISSKMHRRVIASMAVKSHLEVPVFLQHNRMTGDDFGELSAAGAMVCRVRRLALAASTYRISVSLLAESGHGGYLDGVTDAMELTVVEGDYYGTGEVPPSTHGICLADASWRMEPTQNNKAFLAAG